MENLQRLVALRSKSRICKRLESWGYLYAATHPDASKTGLHDILKQGASEKTPWVRGLRYEYRGYQTTVPVDGFLFVIVEINRIHLLKNTSLPHAVLIYCKRWKEAHQ